METSLSSSDPLSPVEQTYTSLIQQYLAVHCLDNATFYAERLYAHTTSTGAQQQQQPSSSSSHALYLLALCYYRQGQPQRSKSVLEQQNEACLHGLASSEILYLKALCCYELDEYALAEEALLRQVRQECRKGSHLDTTSMNEYIVNTSPCPIPNGAVGVQLLAKVCAKSNRKHRAIVYYKMSLNLDPFLWTSWEALCDHGVADLPSSEEVFGVEAISINEAVVEEAATQLPPTTPHIPSSSKDHNRHAPLSTGGVSSMNGILAAQTPDVSTHHSLQARTLAFTSGGGGNPTNNNNTTNTAIFETPNLTPIAKNDEQSFLLANTKSVAVQRARKVVFRDYYQPSPDVHQPKSSSMERSDNKPRSLFWSGLSSDHKLSTSHNKKLIFTSEQKATASASTANTPARPSAPTMPTVHVNHNPMIPPKTSKKVATMDNRNAIDEDDNHDDDNDENKNEAVNTVLQLLCLLGTAQWHLGQFHSKKAIECYQQLPGNHYDTGWVMNQVGKAYFAMADYSNAIRALQVMEQIEPHRMEGLQVLSTALWQTKREVELSHLAQRVTDFDRLSPQVWCVVGNCFSLQKEHETALVFFRRSIQLDRTLPYSHTLSGHEYFANEDLEKAIACFRDAIAADERHYNAWYGLGAVYYRQEKFDLAEYHFHKACTINPQSSVLICHLGMAQNANNKPYESLETLSEINSPQANYQRSLVYQQLERYEEALRELRLVNDAAPREAQIHFAMGRLHQRLGRPQKAMRYFLDALDLDPKDTNLIKSAMEKMEDPQASCEEELSAF
mmetsp:Transcript_23768/g.35092  ORF Transcript_23768/g.35092 Transcript_23768/m.35092 type:complete len:787 (-) Transcript_23768:511-2871(-)|eukprot:CAMPEP_0194208206 /NCGR_PEP_ID=MMETSP0156-20130528/6715_1 /TAXON_ID=33649 /ORGANISM="Thalassionema nitzschioides, Strain L26-B" /LENGTH=786 /DNA_ID=CAMNT_0038935119 /DNA_START=36 /DNA_END=2396 /DNA_ORIENTATION=-